LWSSFHKGIHNLVALWIIAHFEFAKEFKEKRSFP
jgi:hypothetical protein